MTRKITRAVAQISLGLTDKLYLGNLEARRDWGFAGDYVEAMWIMLQQETPDDYVIGTGESHSVCESVEEAYFPMPYPDWEKFVRIDPRYYRPAEADDLRGDCSKARTILGWLLRVTSLPELVAMMVDADLAELRLKLKGGLGAVAVSREA